MEAKGEKACVTHFREQPLGVGEMKRVRACVRGGGVGGGGSLSLSLPHARTHINPKAGLSQM